MVVMSTGQRHGQHGRVVTHVHQGSANAVVMMVIASLRFRCLFRGRCSIARERTRQPHGRLLNFHNLSVISDRKWKSGFAHSRQIGEAGVRGRRPADGPAALEAAMGGRSAHRGSGPTTSAQGRPGETWQTPVQPECPKERIAPSTRKCCAPDRCKWHREPVRIDE